jgi:hypothetical protein
LCFPALPHCLLQVLHELQTHHHGHEPIQPPLLLPLRDRPLDLLVLPQDQTLSPCLQFVLSDQRFWLEVRHCAAVPQLVQHRVLHLGQSHFQLAPSAVEPLHEVQVSLASRVLLIHVVALLVVPQAELLHRL